MQSQTITYTPSRLRNSRGCMPFVRIGRARIAAVFSCGSDLYSHTSLTGSSVDPPGVVSFGSAPPSPLTICTFPVLPQLATSLESGGMYA